MTTDHFHIVHESDKLQQLAREIVLGIDEMKKYKTVILVHGCFWHKHDKCKRASTPKTNEDFWKKKLQQNVHRDNIVVEQLSQLGWNVIVVWECEVRDGTFREKITKTLGSIYYDMKTNKEK